MAIFSTTSCRDLDKKDIYVGDYEQDQIINYRGDTVSCQEEAFNEFTCVNPDALARIKYCLSVCNE